MKSQDTQKAEWISGPETLVKIIKPFARKVAYLAAFRVLEYCAVCGRSADVTHGGAKTQRNEESILTVGRQKIIPIKFDGMTFDEGIPYSPIASPIAMWGRRKFVTEYT